MQEVVFDLYQTFHF